MDPDFTLNELRELAEEDDHTHWAQVFEALDNWLCKGGFLPHDWKVAKKGWNHNE